MPNRKVLIGSLIVTVVLAFAVFALVKLKNGKQVSNGEVVIRVADTTAPSGQEIAYKLTGRDLFKEEGVKLQKIPGITAIPSCQALLTGQYDVAGGGWVGWINVIARGGKIKAVFGTGEVNTRMIGRSGMLVLENSPIHSIKDLHGKTIAVNILGLAAEYEIKIMLKKNGLSFDQVQLLQIPVENTEQALRTKQVDAAIGTPSGGAWFGMALDRGGLRIIPGTTLYEVTGQDSTVSGMGFREDFIQAHPDVVRHYVAAVEKIQQIIWEAFQKDPKRISEVYAEIAKEKGGNPKWGKYYLPTSPEATLVKDSDVQFWIDGLVSEGKLKSGEIKPSDIYTTAFIPSYKERLEKIQRKNVGQ